MTQREIILDYLKENGQINIYESIKHFNITRLSAIILTLRNDGYNIISQPETKFNLDGNHYTYSNYILLNPKWGTDKYGR